MSQGPARAGFLGPGRIALRAHYGRVDRDPQSARGSLLKTNPKVMQQQHHLPYTQRSVPMKYSSKERSE